MKVQALTRMMNNHGTNPRVKVMKHTDDCHLLVYEGRPDNIDGETAELKVHSFTVLGIGYLEIHAK